MQLRTVVLALMGMAVAVEASAIHAPYDRRFLVSRQNKGKGGQNQGKGQATTAAAAAAATAATKASNSKASSNDNNALCLNQNAVQDASAATGQSGQAEAGQVASLTDSANFINFCNGKTLTNGLQNKAGSCNGVVMGEIPAQNNMVSSIITSPVPGKEPQANQDFDVQVQIANMDLGKFTNPNNTYYSAPQQLGSSGNVIGHTHVTIQDMGSSVTPTEPLDATKFAFFKGINDPGNGKGLLQATVTGGLPAGNYRVCTMGSAANHQPILMPVAQRGAQDDCVRITIGGTGTAASDTTKGSKSQATATAKGTGKGKGN